MQSTARLALLVATAAAAVHTAAAQCGASTGTPFSPTAGVTFHDGSGADSNYGSSTTCWTKLSCPGQRVTLDLVTFATERDYDKLVMFEGTATGPTNAYAYEGASISCKLPVELHGDGSTDEVDIDSDIISDGEYLWLKFTSDEATEAAGFTASYSCSCSNLTYETACSGNNGIPNLSGAALTCPYEVGADRDNQEAVATSAGMRSLLALSALSTIVLLAACM